MNSGKTHIACSIGSMGLVYLPTVGRFLWDQCYTIHGTIFGCGRSSLIGKAVDWFLIAMLLKVGLQIFFSRNKLTWPMAKL